LSTYVSPLLKAKADVIILGCTHYPFLKPAIQQLVGERVTILDTGTAIARHTQMQLQSLGLNGEQEGKEKFFCTSNTKASNKLLSELWSPEKSFSFLHI
jgi:glutamate racemase